MKKVSIITAEEAALKVQDGDTIATVLRSSASWL